MHRLLLASLLACAPFALTKPAAAEDWPQWMGPQRDGLTAETGLLQEWPEAGPERVWLFRQAGLGYGGPAIVGSKLYFMGSRQGVEQLIALDARRGRERWSLDLGQEYENGWGNGPRGTPTVDGNLVYALAAQGDLVCVSAKRGKELWRTDLKAIGGQIPKWGYSESPLIADDLVIVTPGGDQGAIAAFDKKRGRLRWQCDALTDEAHYSSPILATIHGQPQIVQLLAERLVGLDPATGELLWQVAWPGRVAVIPTALAHENRIYVTSGYGVGSMLVELDPQSEPTVLYENKVMKNHHGGVVRLGLQLFGHSDGVGWTSQDWLTGERQWRERSELGKGAVGYADGRYYCLEEESGEVVLVEPSTDRWIERGRFKLDPQTNLRKERGKIWTHPVIANGKLYLRDQELFFCFDVAGE